MLGGGFKALLNSALLHKCIQARYQYITTLILTHTHTYIRLWENSKHVARQLEKIGEFTKQKPLSLVRMSL